MYLGLENVQHFTFKYFSSRDFYWGVNELQYFVNGKYSFTIIAGLFRLWIGELTGTDIRDLSDVSCKLINILGYSASDLSVWLIIAVTFERYP